MVSNCYDVRKEGGLLWRESAWLPAFKHMEVEPLARLNAILISSALRMDFVTAALRFYVWRNKLKTTLSTTAAAVASFDYDAVCRLDARLSTAVRKIGQRILKSD